MIKMEPETRFLTENLETMSLSGAAIYKSVSTLNGAISSQEGSIHGRTNGYLQMAIYANYGMLTVHVVQAKSLKAAASVTCNTFVRLCLEPDEDQRTWSKTSVVKETNCPVFDEKFSFELLDEDYRKRLSLSLWHVNQQGESEFLGCMSFGLKHICQQKKKVNGWYHLLGEELGQKKHLHVTMLSKGKPQLKERDINSSLLMPPPPAVKSGHVMSAHLPAAPRSNHMMPPPMNPKLHSSRLMDCSQFNNTSKMMDRSKYHNASRHMDMSRHRINSSSKHGTSLHMNSSRMNRSYMNKSYMNSSHISSSYLSSSHLSTSQTSLSDPYSANNSLDEDNDENVWTDNITILVRRGPRGFGFSISGARPVHVCSLEPGSVADIAGLRDNDQIMKINGVPVTNSSTQEVASIVRQKHCPKMYLEVQRPYTHSDLLSMSSMSKMSMCSLSSRASSHVSKTGSYSFSLSRQDSVSSLASHASSLKAADAKKPKRRRLARLVSSLGISFRR